MSSADLPAPVPPRIRDRAVPADRPAAQRHDLGRYLRQMRLPQLGETGQRRLAGARVAVIGAGGLGAPALTYLAAAGVGEITLFDPDTVDATNLHRQVLFAEADLGRPKAVAAAEHLHAQSPQVSVRAVVEALTPTNALELLAGHDLVLDGTDNFPTRYLASDACEILDLPLVWGSILAFSGQVSVFWGAGGRGVTYRDVHPVPPRPGEVPSCAEAGVLGMLCGVIGSTMAMEAVKVLAGMGDVLFGRLALYDALRARWDELPLARDPQRLPVTEIEDVMLTCGLPGPTGPARDEVTAEELPALLAAGARVIDIREERELAEGGMVAGAEHLPMGELLRRAGGGAASDGHGAAGSERDGTVLAAAAPAGAELSGAVLYCAAGTRSASTQRALAERGIRVRSLAGGFDGLSGSGVEIRRL
ncbi:ThiF family adenylyltransferase [Brachybacterium paraconglomeratum]|uniref:ThiF family adenylyltransferase n=1 Tax=Brachybacterium paraconglomeratum TaxID=173362 RepID=UPI003FD3608B